MSEEITESMTLLKSLNIEIKRLSKDLKELRLQKKDIEIKIINFLEETEKPGVKFEGYVVLAETKMKRERKKKAEKLFDGESVLAKYNVQNPKKVLEELLESMRGNKTEVSCLKTQDIQV